MKLPSFKWFFPIAVLLTICYVNNRYEIFALNIPKELGNKKAIVVPLATLHSL